MTVEYKGKAYFVEARDVGEARRLFAESHSRWRVMDYAWRDAAVDRGVVTVRYYRSDTKEFMSIRYETKN